MNEVKMRNSKYTKEFKDSTVQLVMNSDKSALSIANELDINPKTLYNWVRDIPFYTNPHLNIHSHHFNQFLFHIQ